MLRILPSNDTQAVDALFSRRGARLDEVEPAVRTILQAVRERGDDALVQYAQRLDGLESGSVLVPAEDLAAAARALPDELRAAVDVASRQIRRFAELQMPKAWSKSVGEGIELGQQIRPIDSVAAYIPGGRYPLPSTLLMTVIPAQVADVPLIVACSPSLNPATVGVAGYLGVHKFFQMGGAQAIAAFAYGTETVPKASRIVGPGNAYVAAAKKLVAGDTGIDFVAGPTEILILAAEGDARWIAADMLAQAEHDVDAAAILVTTSAKLASAVGAEVERQLETLPTADVARLAIDRNSAVVICDSMDEACDLSNRFAPEHLSVHDEALVPKLTHAGSLFLGPLSPEAAGDYASGPNHVLPTTGVAALRGGLSVHDYVKVISTQKLTAEGLSRIAPAATSLARAEGLEAHARSVEVRLGD